MEFMTLLLIMVVIVLLVQQRFFFTRKIGELEFRIIRLQELLKGANPVKETDIKGVIKPTEFVAEPSLQKKLRLSPWLEDF